jgi:hypothetical protein
MLKFEGLVNQCLYCKKPMAVRQICRHITDDLKEIEFLDAHKMCKKYALTISFLENENKFLMDRITKNKKDILSLEYKLFLKTNVDK